MSKFVSFRIAKGNETSIRNQLNHDLRSGHIPKYIDSERVKRNRVLLSNIKPNTVKSEIEARKVLIKEKTGRKAQKTAEFFFSGIMTFSEQMTKDYENDPKAFDLSVKQFLTDLYKNYDMKPVSAVLHLDEKTPHIHLVFDNINATTGKGVRRNISPKKLSDIQTKMGEAFKNMGYSRGVPKTTTTAEHISFKDYHKLVAKLEELELDIELIEKVKEEIKNDSKGVIRLVEYFKKSSGKALKEEYKKEIENIFTI